MKLHIDREKHLIKKDGEEIFLSRKEFEILLLLCSVPGKVFPRTKIFQTIWNEKSLSKERTVDVHLVNIRKKLGNKIFKTIKGVGYKITIEKKDIEIKNFENIH